MGRSGAAREPPWLEPGEVFPEPHSAWRTSDPAPGLLAVGGALDCDSLLRAYSHGIFPWFSEGQPILWWSPDPRMVLRPTQFKLHRSLRKTLLQFQTTTGCELRVDTAFESVIQACADSSRSGAPGTWIVPSMVAAYCALHRQGYAHSVETWVNGQLVGGLYCVAIGRAVFGESMFTRQSDASKIALSALVALCLVHGVQMIDCQQNTAHLASLGACEVARSVFLDSVQCATQQSALRWTFDPVYWNSILSPLPA
jgi:leucyl/phenylalanyl-tRNA---protein transferase